MRLLRITFYFFCLFFIACSALKNKSAKVLTDTATQNYEKTLSTREQLAVDKSSDSLGTLLNTIYFQVKTNDLDEFKEGFIPWIELDKSDKDILNLIDKDKIVINESKVSIIIDYPLTNEYRFTLVSDKGFSKEQLVREISKQYHKLYKEEESTATVKTTPAEERKTISNRNQTNGKYGVWGHDIADLALAEILVYKSANGEIFLSLNIES